VRILQINATCGVSSTGRIAADIHHLLIQQNHESLVAYARKTTRNVLTSSILLEPSILPHMFYTHL